MKNTLVRALAGAALLLVLRPEAVAAQASTVSLTVNFAGPQGGRIGIQPIGMLCDGPSTPAIPCTIQVTVGTVIRIVANAPPGTEFLPGRFGAGTGSASACATSTCTFTINTDSTVTATFNSANGPFVIMTTNLDGDGQGAVDADNSRRQNFDPLGFSASTTAYVAGSVVDLTARPAPESRFAGFSAGTLGAAACGSAKLCSFTLNENTSVTATFRAITAITLSPATASLFTTQNRQFSATGTFTDGVTEPVESNSVGVWRIRASMAIERFSHAAAAVGGKLYAIGGIVGLAPGAPSALVEAYDQVTNTWTARASMLTPREGSGAAVVGGLIYVVGGNTAGSVAVANVERYDPSTNTWTARAPLPAPRRFHAVAAVNGIIYALGGETSAGVVGTVDAYDPVADTWTSRASLLAARTGLSATEAHGLLYVAGGGNGSSTLPGVEVYNPATNTWTTRSQSPNPRAAVGTASADGVFYVVGGGGGSTIASFDAPHNSWINKFPMNTQRDGFAVVALDGRLYVTGGQMSDGTRLRTVEAFSDGLRWSSSNPAVATVNQFSPTASVVGVSAGEVDIRGTIGSLSCAASNACSRVTVTVNTVLAALDHTTLAFGATNSGSALLTSTPNQAVRLTKSGFGTVTWTATTNQPWLRVMPSSGTATSILSIGVVFDSSLPVSGTLTGAVSIQLTGADNAVGPINVTFNVQPTGASAAPFGAIDTPLEGAAGVVGSIAVTGWALDDLGVSQVRIVRNAVAGEGGGDIFLGIANIVEGARPDVATSFPGAPKGTAAGWGYLLLTNFLPNQGNGTFTLSAYADDVDGHSTLLGSRTITCTNSVATTPFGAIDTPGQGDTVSGSVNNFGWVLSPGSRRADPTSGGIVNVFIDGAPVGVPGGWAARPDLQTLFPIGSYSGVDNALGVFTFDSTLLTNGVHTLAWGVTDNQGGGAGVGSRYFTVSNGSGLTTGVAQGFSSDVAQGFSPDVAQGFSPAPTSRPEGLRYAISGRRGYDLDAPYQTHTPGSDGRVTVQSEEIDRIELLLGRSESGRQFEGALRVGNSLEPLPIGSRIDAATGTFTWQPGPGFVGAYDLVFTSGESRRDVRIVLNPKQSNRAGPQIVIDRASPDVAGWAVDLASRVDSGIGAIHVWAYPVVNERRGDPIFVGVAAYGGARPDVAALHGERFNNSGYGLVVRGLAPGAYDLAVFAYSTVTGGFGPAQTVRIDVK